MIIINNNGKLETKSKIIYWLHKIDNIVIQLLLDGESNTLHIFLI